MRFREHRGGLIDSMSTVVEVGDTAMALRRYLNGISIPEGEIEIKPYMFDKRIGWDTHIVTMKGYGVIGFTDKGVKDG